MAIGFGYRIKYQRKIVVDLKFFHRRLRCRTKRVGHIQKFAVFGVKFTGVGNFTVAIFGNHGK